MIKQLLFIFAGGGIGSILRFFFSRWFNPLVAAVPLGTFLANVVSSFIVGFIVALPCFKSETNLYRYFIITGICGGFSTFSGFSNETFTMMQAGNYHFAAMNIALNVVVCLLAVAGGMKLASVM